MAANFYPTYLEACRKRDQLETYSLDICTGMSLRLDIEQWSR